MSTDTIKLKLENSPAISGGMGWFTLNPGLIQIPFWSSNKEEHKNNTYPWYDDKDIQKAKETATRIVLCWNEYDQLKKENEKLNRTIDGLLETGSSKLSINTETKLKEENERLKECLEQSLDVLFYILNDLKEGTLSKIFVKQQLDIITKKINP